MQVELLLVYLSLSIVYMYVYKKELIFISSVIAFTYTHMHVCVESCTVGVGLSSTHIPSVVYVSRDCYNNMGRSAVVRMYLWMGISESMTMVLTVKLSIFMYQT